MQEDETSLLIKDALQGDGTALMRLFENELEPMYRTAALLLGGYEEALKVVCTAMLEGRELLSLVEDEGSFSAWAKRRVVFTTLQMISDRTVFGGEDLGSTAESDSEWPKARLKQLPKDRFEELLRRELSSLPDDARIAFVLHDMEGFTVGEVSEFMDKPIDQVKDLAGAARLALASRLSWTLQRTPQRAGAGRPVGAALKVTMAVATFHC